MSYNSSFPGAAGRSHSPASKALYVSATPLQETALHCLSEDLNMARTAFEYHMITFQ